MKKNVALLFLLFLLPSIVSPQTSGTAQKALTLTHVTVIDTTGGPAQPDMTVVIRGDRIASMGKSGKIRVPAGSRVVNAAGKFLIPGLWDMDVLWYEPDYLPLFIANGVTGVRETIGYAEQYEWREEVEAGQLLGPRMVVASRWMDGGSPNPWTVSLANEAEARQAVVNAQKYGADAITLGGGETLTRETFFALADEAKKRGIPLEGAVPVSVSIEEASLAGMASIDEQPAMFGFELILAECSSRESDLLKSWRALASKQPEAWDTFWYGPSYREPIRLALDTYDQQKAEALFALLKANHTWVSPTLVGQRNTTFLDDPALAGDSRTKYMSAEERSWWSDMRGRYAKTFGAEGLALRKRAYQKELEIVGAMRRAGVDFLAGTTTEDPLFAVAGFSLHDELDLFVRAGFTPLEALQTATLNPARFLGREHDFGTVAPGKIADLVLLDANPLEDISNTREIAAVVYRGKLYPRASLDAMLAKMEALGSRKYIGDVFAATMKEKGVEAAIRQYRELKSTQPGSYYFGDAYGGLGPLGDELRHAKKFADAIRILEMDIEARPNSWWAYDRLGDAYMEAGKKDLAIKNFRKSLKLDPAQAYAAFRLKQLNSQ
ncbi:MAG TPA: amidohydrolase family protein [Candidatus Sulfotelmatobacter sp.]|nr:amidohydrolase family protein [Candidatus Sulfotelmatobacter sp.]